MCILDIGSSPLLGLADTFDAGASSFVKIVGNIT